MDRALYTDKLRQFDRWQVFFAMGLLALALLVNVASLFSLVPRRARFQPTIAAAPVDRDLDLVPIPSPPSPASVSVVPSVVTIGPGVRTTSFTYSDVAAGASALSAGTSYIPASSQITAGVSPIPASFFGLTVLNFGGVSPAVKFGTTRSWDAYPSLDWSDANLSGGTYNFADLDNFIAVNQARGSEIIYTLGRTPQWASSQPYVTGAYGPGQCAPPADLRAWDDYIRAIVTHAAGRIKYWELWDEANDPNFYCGDIPTMVTLAQHANQIIKEIAPSALILSPSVSGGPGPEWLSSFLTDGGGTYVDVIAFHGYWSANAEVVVNVIESYKNAMTANGAGGMPLWDTESSWAGFGDIGTPSSGQQVGFIAKDYLLHWSQGVSRFVWYAYDGGPIWGGLWSSSTGASAAASAYNETYRWMVGASLTAPCSANQSKVWTCTFSRGGGYTAQAIWISNSTTTVIVPTRYVEYRDLAGVVHKIVNHRVTVGDKPLLLETAALP
jgi:hypothetical protein